MRAGIALGSNLGDRRALLESAVTQIKAFHERGDFLLSSFYETEPQGCPPESPRFLNAVLEMECSLDPLELLHRLQILERQAGRPKAHAFHGPRTLDLDILYCDQILRSSAELQLPHPRIIERLFVLQPLAEIRPDLQLPGWSLNCQDYLFKFYNK